MMNIASPSKVSILGIVVSVHFIFLETKDGPLFSDLPKNNNHFTDILMNKLNYDNFVS